MHRIFLHPLTVPGSAIDELNHANNVEYLRWMQAAATAHSEALGWPQARYLEHDLAWVVRSHKIDYLEPAVLGDQLVVATWVATMRPCSSLRRYRCFRLRDGRCLAEAETYWVFIHLSSQRMVPVPAEVKAVFQVVDESPDEELAQLLAALSIK